MTPELSDEEHEELLFAVLDDAPEWNEWANWAMSKTPGGLGEAALNRLMSTLLED